MIILIDLIIIIICGGYVSTSFYWNGGDLIEDVEHVSVEGWIGFG